MAPEGVRRSAGSRSERRSLTTQSDLSGLSEGAGTGPEADSGASEGRPDSLGGRTGPPLRPGVTCWGYAPG